MVDIVHDMVLEVRQMNVLETEEAIGIAYERVVHILHNELGMR